MKITLAAAAAPLNFRNFLLVRLCLDIILLLAQARAELPRRFDKSIVGPDIVSELHINGTNSTHQTPWRL